ncbi:Putative disease resistance protein RGA1 [Dendrobium catenatum]|uniref:Disease resistance protein RGA1 n=1 Tax=Dendrobium catenatum TaxID=906689 RepID=A0A2I0W9Z4_9ASPA|nr:Putative disease resistance protein RGA1 [Dendrobium catenatum]
MPLVQSYTTCETMKPNSNDAEHSFVERIYNPLVSSGFLIPAKQTPLYTTNASEDFLLLRSKLTKQSNLVNTDLMEGWFGGPVMKQLITTGFQYLEDQVRRQTGIKEELERLQQNHPNIYISTQECFRIEAMAGWVFGPILENIRNTCFDFLEDQLVLHTDMNEALERLQKLHPKIQSVIFACNQDQIIDPALNRWLWQLRDAIDEADDEQQPELYKARETGSLPRNDLIGRGKDKEFVNGTDLYRNISLLSIVGHGGMGKTTLLQHVYEDKKIEEFDLNVVLCMEDRNQPPNP